MTVYLDPQRNGFAQNLNAAIKRFDNQGKRFLLVHTPKKGYSLEEPEEYSSLSRLFSSSVYRAEENFVSLVSDLTLSREHREVALLSERMALLADTVGKKKRQDYANIVQQFQIRCRIAIRSIHNESRQPVMLVAAELGLFRAGIQIAKSNGYYDFSAARTFRDQFFEAALQEKEWKIALHLFQNGANLTRAKELHCLNPLLYEAVEQKLENLAHEILVSGCIVEAIPSRIYVLHRAIELGLSCDLITLLLKHDADPNYPQAQNRVAFKPLSYALERGRYDLVGLFLQRGANPNESHPISQLPVVVCLIQAKKEEYAISCVERGANLQYRDRFGSSLLHLAAQHGMKRLARVLTERGIAPNVLDLNNGTAAFLAPPDMLQTLVDIGVDLSLRNKSGNTALSFRPGTTPPFTLGGILIDLASFRKKPETILQVAPRHNPLEVCFFLQDVAATKAVAAKMKQADFETRLWELQAKYPKFSTESIALAPYEVDPKHMERAFDISKIPPKPSGVDLQDLLTIFDTIDFRREFKPSAYSSDLKDMTVEELREKICERVVDRVKNREQDAGTGRRGTTFFVLFYDKLESALLHITQKLKTLGNDPESRRTKAFFFFELALHTPLCCEQLSQCACNWYNHLLRNIPTTFENYIFSTLTASRESILRSLIIPNTQTNHDMHHLKFLIGKEFGIEGADFYTKADAYRSYAYPSKTVMLDKAMQRYKVVDIIDCMHPQIIDFQKWRDKAREHCQQHAPASWKRDHYAAIRAHVVEMQKAGKDEREVKAYLQTKDIFYQTGTALEAIEADRGGAYYLEEGLVSQDTFTMRRPAIARMLHDTGVLLSICSDQQGPRPKPSLLQRAKAGFEGLRSWLPW